jgi:hypothetical protein
MNDCASFIEHREQLKNPHRPPPRASPRRFPRLLARFNYREPRQHRPARQK